MIFTVVHPSSACIIDWCCASTSSIPFTHGHRITPSESFSAVYINFDLERDSCWNSITLHLLIRLDKKKKAIRIRESEMDRLWRHALLVYLTPIPIALFSHTVLHLLKWQTSTRITSCFLLLVKQNKCKGIKTTTVARSCEIDGDTDQFFFGVVEGEASRLASSSNSSRSRLTLVPRLPTSIYGREDKSCDSRLRS